MKKLMIAVILSLVLSGCSKTKENDLTLYDSVVEKYTEYTTNQTMVEDISGMVFLYNDSYYTGLYSVLYDIDNNGTPELLISVKGMDGYYRLLDIRTIVNNELIKLTNKENGMDNIGERMIVEILEDGKLVYSGSAGAVGGSYSLHELNETKNDLVEISNGQSEEDLGELVPRIDFKKLDWSSIGLERELSTADYMKKGYFTTLEGMWKNGEGSIINITGDKLTYLESPEYGENTITFHSEKSKDEIFMNVTADLFGALMIYITEDYKGELKYVIGSTEPNVEKLIITQSSVGPEEVYYRIND